VPVKYILITQSCHTIKKTGAERYIINHRKGNTSIKEGTHNQGAYKVSYKCRNCRGFKVTIKGYELEVNTYFNLKASK
jgi:hypothetical protein